ncbi:hypothetical protein [Providencia alcalifaciens]|uniref:hypothetical protein n=1 Tax=Providencia alcalifaciens TaxID=126385 RepID=UPI00044A0BB5|nr:hypothetical protein [Providencia alcalifaciens]EUD08526.1 hypothetical protein HMPREF1564_3539 [Providencia alcalifaciens R90-1475]
MAITLRDIKAARNEIMGKYRERLTELQGYAKSLLNTYVDSLEMESDTWVNDEGQNMSYVNFGVLDEKGKFKKSGVAMIHLNEDRALDFAISTIVCDSSINGGESIVVGIGLRKEGKSLYVRLDGLQDEIYIGMPDDTDAFVETSSFIKQLIIRRLRDPRLD